MDDDKIRLGGMALAQRRARARPDLLGVRGPPPRRLAEGRRRARSASSRNRIEIPLLRGPARLAEAVAVLPALKRRLPEAKLPFEQPSMLAAMVASAVGVRVVRGSRLGPAAQELAAGAARARARAAVAARQRPRRVSRRRAHLDRQLRARRAARAGARALRLASDRAAARDVRRRERRRRLACPLATAARTRRRVARGARRGDRALRLDGAQSRQEARARAREAGPRAPAPLRDEGAERPSRSRSPRRRSARASSSNRVAAARASLQETAPRCRWRAPNGRHRPLLHQPAELAALIWVPMHLLRRDRLPALAHDLAMPRVRPAPIEAQSRTVDRVDRRRRPRGGEGGALRGRRLPAPSRALRAARRARAEGDPALRPARDRQDADGEGRRLRVGRELLRAERLGVRRDVRRARRGAHPQALRGGAQERAGDHLHRRARCGRRRAQRPRLQPRAGPDAQPAARRARRLRRHRARRRDGRVEPAPGSRPGAAPPGPLRPADARLAARSRRPRGDPQRAHARQAARGGRRPAPDREADGRADRRRPREHLQRGGDLRRPQGARSTCATPSSTRRWSASSPACSSGAS